LVEIMVAMVIGMFGVTVMVQVFALSEERKRTTTSGGDAMTEGVMALYAVQRDVRMSGYDIADTKLLGCDVVLNAGVTLSAMAPLTINHASITGQDANTDTLVVVYGNSNSSPQGDSIIAAGTTSYSVQTPNSFNANDRVIASPQTRAAPCSLTLDQVGSPYAPPAAVPVNTGVARSVGDTLFNLGQQPRVVAYAVRNGNLTMCDFMVNDCGDATNNGNAAIWVPIGSNIVSLRAEYGADSTATMDGFVDVFNRTTPTTACGWARISAARLALVARSGQFEKTSVTTVAPVWDGTADGVAIDVSKKPDGSSNADWQNYRYKVFQTVIPLRNIAWMGVPTGC
jgi:type IV pilus assembly protein PilW